VAVHAIDDDGDFGGRHDDSGGLIAEDSVRWLAVKYPSSVSFFSSLGLIDDGDIWRQ
jgi:hypothetical protein